MARLTLFVIAALCIFSYVQIGESLKCYGCNGDASSDCALNPSKNPDFVKNCTEQAHDVCLTHNTTLLIGASQITRDCAARNVCDQKVASVNVTCVTCERDLCNSSPSVAPTYFLISIISLMLVKIFM